MRTTGDLPRVHFVAEAARCPLCDGALKVYKSRSRQVVTFKAGSFLATETLMQCAGNANHPVMNSRTLGKLVAPHQRFGYDLVVEVGCARYLDNKQRTEIQEELYQQRGIELSSGSISHLCDRFLTRLESLHLARTPQLRAILATGYPLHLDATCELGKGGLFVCMDGRRGWVLVAGRIPSEHADHLRPLVEKTTHLFGDPVATVQDMGKGVVREDLPALVLWILEGDGSKDLVYPFGLVHLTFFQRCQQAHQRAECWVQGPRTLPERRAMAHLATLVQRLDKDERFVKAATRLEEGWQAFCELRDVLQLTNAELPRADVRVQQKELAAIEARRMQEIKEALRDYRGELAGRVAASDEPGLSTSPDKVIVKYIDRYAKRLFGHPLLRDEDGEIVAIVERTNNVVEHFFGTEKQHLRRRLGRANLGRDLEDQPAQVALAANLRHPDYVRVLCGHLDQLPMAFAQLDEQALAQATPLTRSNRDTELQKLIRARLKNENRIDSSSKTGNPTVV